ncbi:response regulator transcription factor [Proteiniclasticum sp. QWL-01]|uniref:response regulator transcription factor n=1 Tax=Proteiniclasticum sp. QWL-01 TaxID=3036945 RepID=UPI00220E91CB|nr:response regulator transcription factor [Proteiniclasticum sp. QWL-01]UUM10628.1 response regulator transcription factor [Clostridiaceae bacterium HFYG-1003]WFF71963.1 response regulator transcription factor [Proteiniclasticum sp. QWL-01]
MEDKRKILVVEDERKLARFIELELKHAGYDVETANEGQTAIMNIMNNQYDAIILDLMIPIIDGIEVCRRVRKFSNVPIIILTARDGVKDKVEGLDLGANDYMTKPFEMEELLARLRVIFRKEEEVKDKSLILSVGDLMLNKETYEVRRDSDRKELTKKEFDLLAYLMENQGIVLSREKILNQVWGFDFEGETNVVDVYIRFLRSKIDDKYDKKLIHTMRGAGYTIRDIDEN